MLHIDRDGCYEDRRAGWDVSEIWEGALISMSYEAARHRRPGKKAVEDNRRASRSVNKYSYGNAPLAIQALRYVVQAAMT